MWQVSMRILTSCRKGRPCGSGSNRFGAKVRFLRFKVRWRELRAGLRRASPRRSWIALTPSARRGATGRSSKFPASLWEDLPPDAERISQKDLESFGDVNQALSEFYEKAIEKIVAEGLAKEGELRQWFEHALITPALTRGMVFRDVTTTGGIPNEAVAELEKLHLVRGENRAGGRWYELTHDRLVEPVLHSNSQWRARHAQAEHIRMQLESGASAWIAAGRGTHGLLNKDQLDDASRWLQSQEAQELGVSESVLTFVAASREEVQKQNLARARELALEQQRRAEEQTLVAKRLRLLAAGLIIFFFVALGFAFYSGSQRNKAKRD